MKKLLIITICLFTTFPTLATNAVLESENHREVHIDSLDLSIFMDGLLTATMKERKIAGASMIIIKDDEILLKHGYGYADLDNKVKVNPDSTLFRIGSISKVFTWISLMQLIENGVYDLDTDINEYLEDINIPEAFESPVTIRSLMSHTPGFEDILIKLFVRTPEEMQPLKEILKSQMPKRVRPPLEYAAYSNHGTGIAQYLVELASGVSFEEYVEQNILEPFGMDFTTFRQPIPEHLSEHMSKGYAFENGVITEKYFEFVPMTGVGGASTTAKDISKLAKALLNFSCLDTICLLDTLHFVKMTEPVLYHADGLNPALLGFMDGSTNGVKIFGHGGDTFWFHSLLAIIPEFNIGFFLTFNSEGGGGAYSQVFNQFMDRYIPDERELFDVVNLDLEYLEAFTGKYKANRYPHSDVFKIISIMGAVKISIENNMLRMDGMSEKASFWVPIDSLRFRNIETNELIAFEMHQNKNTANKLFLGSYGIIAFERIEGFYCANLHIAILIATVFTILFIILGWPFIALIRKNHQRNLPAPLLIPFPAKLVAWICAACFMIFLLLIMLSTSGAGQELIMRIPIGVKIAMFFPFLAIPFLLLMILQSVILWKMKDIKWRSRLFYYFSIIIFLAFYWQLTFWNILGWNY